MNVVPVFRKRVVPTLTDFPSTFQHSWC